MASSTFAVANQKGGVSKTTSTVCIGGALAENGHSVLLVDADPQGYLSRLLGFETEYNTVDPNLADALNEPGDYQLQDLILKHEEFDVLPSSIAMFSVQQDLIATGHVIAGDAIDRAAAVFVQRACSRLRHASSQWSSRGRGHVESV